MYTLYTTYQVFYNEQAFKKDIYLPSGFCHFSSLRIKSKHIMKCYVKMTTILFFSITTYSRPKKSVTNQVATTHMLAARHRIKTDPNFEGF